MDIQVVSTLAALLLLRTVNAAISNNVLYIIFPVWVYLGWVPQSRIAGYKRKCSVDNIIKLV